MVLKVGNNEYSNLQLVHDLVYAELFSGIQNSTGLKVLIKKYKAPLTTKFQKRCFKREIELANSIAHCSIDKVLDFHVSADTAPIIVKKYHEIGSLDLIFRRNITLTEKQKLIIAFGIANAMKYLHSQKIVHRDLKPVNIFLDSNYEPHITDLGNAKIEDGRQSIICGTPLWMAPELFAEESYDNKIDIYAYGMILYQLVTGTWPYREGITVGELERLIDAGKVPQLPLNLPKFLSELIVCCFSKDPSKRPTFSEICETLKQNCNQIKVYALKVEDCAESLIAEGNIEYAKHNIERAKQLYQQAFDKGSPIAMYYLGAIETPEKSLICYSKAADRGCPEAKLAIAKICLSKNELENALKYLDGTSDESLYLRGYALLQLKGEITDLKKSADSGNLNAIVLMAAELEKRNEKELALSYYEKGISSNNIQCIIGKARLCDDDQEALNLYAKGAKLGDIDCQYNAGYILYQYGRPKDAKIFLKPSAEAGQLEAQFMMGKILTEEGETEEAKIYLEYAAKAGHSDAKKLLSGETIESSNISDELTEVPQKLSAQEILNKARSTQNPVEAFELFKKAAQMKDPEALLFFGACFEKGRGCEQNIEEALSNYKESADMGNVLAMYNYATVSQKRGEKDIAITYYKKAADAGNADAQLSYANLMAQTNIEETAKYSKLSADNGNAKAQCLYGQLLYIGSGCQKDLQLSKKYITASAAQGYERAIKLCQELGF